MTQRAIVEPKIAYLHTDFAREFVTRQFGQLAADAIYEILPKITRGAHKGESKGVVTWRKCSVGGWFRGDDGGWHAEGPSGYVMKPGTHDVTIRANVYGRGIEAGARRGNMTDEQWRDWCVRAIKEIFSIKETL